MAVSSSPMTDHQSFPHFIDIKLGPVHSMTAYGGVGDFVHLIATAALDADE
jgi:hypothetical protein